MCVERILVEFLWSRKVIFSKLKLYMNTAISNAVIVDKVKTNVSGIHLLPTYNIP